LGEATGKVGDGVTWRSENQKKKEVTSKPWEEAL